MTPAEHLAEAERLITDSGHGNPPMFYESNYPELLAALGHAVIAAAAELGVPHADTGGGAASATPQAAAG